MSCNISLKHFYCHVSKTSYQQECHTFPNLLLCVPLVKARSYESVAAVADGFPPGKRSEFLKEIHDQFGRYSTSNSLTARVKMATIQKTTCTVFDDCFLFFFI